MKQEYKFKVISNMPKFNPIYFHTKEDAEKKQNELLEQWSMINVYVLVVDLEKDEFNLL